MTPNQITQKIGVYRVLSWVGILLAVGTILLSACTGRSTPAASVPISGANQPVATAPASAAKNATVKTTNTSVATAAPVPLAGGDPKQAVFNAINAVQKAGPYRTHATITSGDKTITSSGEFIPPDRIHINANGQEIIAIGSKGYTKVNGKWVASTMDASAFISSMQGGLTQEVEKGMSDFQYVGPDILNGVPTSVYQFKEVFGSGSSQITSQVKMWINAQGLPVRQVIQGEFNGVKSQTVQDITYDPTIKIEAPTQ